MEKYYFLENGKVKGTYSYEDLLNYIGSLLYERVETFPNGKAPYSKPWRFRNEYPSVYVYKLRKYRSWNGKEECATEFFRRFSHNPNDGIINKGYWDEKYINVKYFNEITQEWGWTRELVERTWIEPKFVPHPYQVIDNLGRIINSKDIKKDFYNHSYDPSWQKNSSTYKLYNPRMSRRYYWGRKQWYDVNNNYLGFRRGPVPGIRSYRNGYWHQNRGDHGHTIQELKQYHRDIIEQKIIKEEFGVTFKVHRKPAALNPWNHAHHGGSKGKGWKRSRNKQKQWM